MFASRFGVIWIGIRKHDESNNGKLSDFADEVLEFMTYN